MAETNAPVVNASRMNRQRGGRRDNGPQAMMLSALRVASSMPERAR